MPNVLLTYISVCERMQAYEHTLANADAIRCSVLHFNAARLWIILILDHFLRNKALERFKFI